MRILNGYHWPEDDIKLAQVFDYVRDIDVILQHTEGRSVCVQAGGACGVWPAEFAKHFAAVYTFEPVPENWACLEKNIPDNVTAFNSAIGANTGSVTMCRDAFEDKNAGAWYAKKGGDVPVMTIDSLELKACDLIQLDVEGFEPDAIQGAMKTIKQFKPVIVLEEKRLPHMTGSPDEARNILAKLGYKQVGEIHRDIILKC